MTTAMRKTLLKSIYIFHFYNIFGMICFSILFSLFYSILLEVTSLQIKKFIETDKDLDL